MRLANQNNQTHRVGNSTRRGARLQKYGQGERSDKKQSTVKHIFYCCLCPVYGAYCCWSLFKNTHIFSAGYFANDLCAFGGDDARQQTRRNIGVRILGCRAYGPTCFCTGRRTGLLIAANVRLYNRIYSRGIFGRQSC